MTPDLRHIGRRVLYPIRGTLDRLDGTAALVATTTGSQWFPRVHVTIADREPYRRCRYCGDWMMRVCRTCGPPESTQTHGHAQHG